MVSVIIVSFNTCAETVACLRALAGLKPAPQIILVDNNSSDGTACRVAAEFPFVELVLSPCNSGFAKGNNLGSRQARGEYLLFLNSDCFVKRDTLDTLANYLDRNVRVGIVGCRLLNSDGFIQKSAWKAAGPWNDFLTLFGWRKLSSVWRRYPDRPVEAEVISGALMMVRRECFEALSGFDENFVLYVEDADLCCRARKLGWQVMYLPLTEAVHVGGTSQAKISAGKYPLIAQSRSYFYRKHHGSGALALFLGMHIVSFPFRALAYLLLATLHDRKALCRLKRDATLIFSLLFDSAPHSL